MLRQSCQVCPVSDVFESEKVDSFPSFQFPSVDLKSSTMLRSRTLSQIAPLHLLKIREQKIDDCLES